VVGVTTAEPVLRVEDGLLGDVPVELPLEVLLGKPPRMHREARRVPAARTPFRLQLPIEEAADRVLRFPAVADKSFLVTIGDRSVTGQVARDQMVGPWQVPVADCAVTHQAYEGYRGEVMAVGERTPLALLDGPASARMAVGEALTNLAAAPVQALDQVVLSANWMAPAGYRDEDAVLYDMVQAVGVELCPALGIAIPVGKDSMSMRTVWDGGTRSVTAPVSLVVSAFAPCADVRGTLTPELRLDVPDTVLLLVDLGMGRDRLGGSVLAQVCGELGDVAPDLDAPELLTRFFAGVQAARPHLLAYHDRSDGGLFVALAEMAFASRCGLRVEVPSADPVAALFAEELGAVVQVRAEHVGAVRAAFDGLRVELLGEPTPGRRLELRHEGRVSYAGDRVALHRAWSSVSSRIQSLRDDPECAAEAYDRIEDDADPGLSPTPVCPPVAAPVLVGRPRVAILREQGVNGHVEMAAAFDRAGFTAVDVHMTDLLEGRQDLVDMVGVVGCGGFSYGDVLGAGGGWAASIVHHPRVREVFARFFGRADTFSLGVCNGCQMFSQLAELVPGASPWPRFVQNRSEQFEARLAQVRIEQSPSVLFRGLEGRTLLVPVAHGEGRAVWSDDADRRAAEPLVVARFTDGRGRVARTYPWNPNGSPDGITALTTPDGRATILMPHPERVYRWTTLSWCPTGWRRGDSDESPWMDMFRNARRWVG